MSVSHINIGLFFNFILRTFLLIHNNKDSNNCRRKASALSTFTLLQYSTETPVILSFLIVRNRIIFV